MVIKFPVSQTRPYLVFILIFFSEVMSTFCGKLHRPTWTKTPRPLNILSAKKDRCYTLVGGVLITLSIGQKREFEMLHQETAHMDIRTTFMAQISPNHLLNSKITERLSLVVFNNAEKKYLPARVVENFKTVWETGYFITSALPCPFIPPPILLFHIQSFGC